MITWSFCMDEVVGTVIHVLLDYFYSFIRYWPTKNDEAQVSWNPLQLFLVVSLILMRKVWHCVLEISRFILTPLSYFPSSPFQFQSQAAFHSTKANHATPFLFPAVIQATLFYFVLIFSFACFFLNHSSSSMLFPNAVYLDHWKQEVVSVLS